MPAILNEVDTKRKSVVDAMVNLFLLQFVYRFMTYFVDAKNQTQTWAKTLSPVEVAIDSTQRNNTKDLFFKNNFIT